METNALVLAIKDRKAVILASGGMFAEIKNQDYFVGQKIVWKQSQAHTSADWLRRGLMLAACLVMMLTASGYAAAKYLPWSVVNVALGESTIQYRLNAWNELLSAETDTEDGQAILATVDTASFEPLETIMERTLSTAQQKQNTPVSVEIATRYGDGRQTEEAVAEAGKATEIHVTIEKVTWQDAGMPRERPPQAENYSQNVPQNDPDNPDAEKPRVPMGGQPLQPMFAEGGETLSPQQAEQLSPAMEAPNAQDAINDPAMPLMQSQETEGKSSIQTVLPSLRDEAEKQQDGQVFPPPFEPVKSEKESSMPAPNDSQNGMTEEYSEQNPLSFPSTDQKNEERRNAQPFLPPQGINTEESLPGQIPADQGGIGFVTVGVPPHCESF